MNWFWKKNEEMPSKEEIETKHKLYILQQKIEMPSIYDLQNKKVAIRHQEEEENNQDCEYMMNLLNKTIKDSLKGTYGYASNDIRMEKLNDYVNIDIRRCKKYDKYLNELKERKIGLELSNECAFGPYVYFDLCRNNLKIHWKYLGTYKRENRFIDDKKE